MAEPIPNPTPTPEPTPEPSPTPTPAPAPGPEKTFTQADLDAAIAAAKEQWKAGLKEQLENAKSEGEKLAKMTAAERKAEEERIEREKFEKERAEFERKSLISEVKSQLADKGLPVSFAEMVAGADAETAKKNIELLGGEWSKAISAAVDERLRASAGTPKTGSDSGRQMSGIEKAFYKINPNLRR